MELNAKTVNDTFLECLLKEGESTENSKIGEGVMIKAKFNPERLKKNESLIEEMLAELPNEFQKSGGGGWSFLNMCEDKNGNQWADLHQTMDELLALGIAIGKISFLMPREMWNVLPGGMPYLVIN